MFRLVRHFIKYKQKVKFLSPLKSIFIHYISLLIFIYNLNGYDNITS